MQISVPVLLLFLLDLVVSVCVVLVSWNSVCVCVQMYQLTAADMASKLTNTALANFKLPDIAGLRQLINIERDAFGLIGTWMLPRQTPTPTTGATPAASTTPSSSSGTVSNNNLSMNLTLNNPTPTVAANNMSSGTNSNLSSPPQHKSPPQGTSSKLHHDSPSIQYQRKTASSTPTLKSFSADSGDNGIGAAGASESLMPAAPQATALDIQPTPTTITANADNSSPASATAAMTALFMHAFAAPLTPQQQQQLITYIKSSTDWLIVDSSKISQHVSLPGYMLISV
jgi:hypothetical protein